MQPQSYNIDSKRAWNPEITLHVGNNLLMHQINFTTRPNFNKIINDIILPVTIATMLHSWKFTVPFDSVQLHSDVFLVAEILNLY